MSSRHVADVPAFASTSIAWAAGQRMNFTAEDAAWTCVLGDVVDDLLTNQTTGSMANELIPLAAALKSMKRANSGLTWIQQKHVSAFLRNIAVAPDITHETFDKLPDSRTREYVRGLLIEHGVLPRRDELRTRYENWSADVIERTKDLQHRDIVRRYRPLASLAADEPDGRSQSWHFPPGQAASNRRHRSAQLAHRARHQPERTKPGSS